MHRSLPLALGLAMSSACSPAEPPFRIAVTVLTDGSCSTSVDGEPIAQGALELRLAELPKATPIRVVLPRDGVPYRCVGATIYVVQAAGFASVTTEQAGR